MNKKTLIIIFFISGLFVTSLITRNGNFIVLSLFMVSYLVVSIVFSPEKEKVSLKAERYIRLHEKENSAIIDIKVFITNTGKKPVSFITSDILHEGMKLVDGNINLHTALAPGKKTMIKYRAESRRGNYIWGDLKIDVFDPLECNKIEISVNAYAKTVVRPVYKKIKSFPIRAWKTLSSPGNIPVQQGGSGTDFYGIREYQPGDPLKSLEWRMNARYPNRFFTKEFVLEKTTEIALVIDGRTSMDLDCGGKNLFEIEINTAAALSELFLCQGYRTGFYTFGNISAKVPSNYGKKQLNRILDCLAGLNNDTRRNEKVIYNLTYKKFSTRTLFVIISPVGENDLNFYRRLRSSGFQVILISPDTYDFAKSLSGKDNLSSMAFRISALERKMNLKQISQLFVSVVDWQIDRPLTPLIKRILQRPLRIKKA